MTAEESQELDAPIKIKFTGKLRSRLQERYWDYAATKNDDGEWVVAEDAEEAQGDVYRVLTRQKTNAVIENCREAASFYNTINEFTDSRRATWLNGQMRKMAVRIRSELLEEMQARGFEPVRYDTFAGVRRFER